MPGTTQKIRELLEALFAAIAEEAAAGGRVSVLVIELVLLATEREFEDLDAAVKAIRAKPSPAKGTDP